jgi:hypothetical protein
MSDDLRIDDVRLREDHDQVVVEIAVTNLSQRTLHAHVTPRMVHYDPDTRALAVELTDENMRTDVLSTARQLPRFKAVDPGSESTLKVTLPRIMHQMASEARDGEPVIETLPIHEAQSVKVSVAWSDTPFYPDPRDRGERAPSDVVTWQKGLAIGEGGTNKRPRRRR